MNAVIAPASASAAAAAANAPTRDDDLGARTGRAQRDHDERREDRRGERHQAERREGLGVARERGRDEIGRADLVPLVSVAVSAAVPASLTAPLWRRGRAGVPGPSARHPAPECLW